MNTNIAAAHKPQMTCIHYGFTVRTYTVTALYSRAILPFIFSQVELQ